MVGIEASKEETSQKQKQMTDSFISELGLFKILFWWKKHIQWESS